MLTELLKNHSMFYVSNTAFFIMLVFLSACFTYLCRKYVRIMDTACARSSHTGAIPRSGGIAIVVSYCIGILLYYVLQNDNFVGAKPYWGLFLSSLMIAVVSLYDDITNKAFAYKFLSQFVGVIILMAFGLTIKKLTIPYFGNVELGIWGYPLTILWIVGITNAFNFMDGINGLAAGTAVLVGLGFTLITFMMGSGFVFHVSYMLAAAALGFLIFNFPKGTIFMGDVGSTFLGFSFGAIAILAANYDQSHTPFLITPILFANFIMETLFTVIWRLCQGHKIYQAHRMHPYQLLHMMGWEVKSITLFYYLQTIILAALAFYYIKTLSNSIVIIIFTIILISYSLYFYCVRYRAMKYGTVL